MMLPYNEEEVRLHEQLKNDNLTEQERKKINDRIVEIYKEKTKDCPFVH